MKTHGRAKPVRIKRAPGQNQFHAEWKQSGATRNHNVNAQESKCANAESKPSAGRIKSAELRIRNVYVRMKIAFLGNQNERGQNHSGLRQNQNGRLVESKASGLRIKTCWHQNQTRVPENQNTRSQNQSELRQNRSWPDASFALLKSKCRLLESKPVFWESKATFWESKWNQTQNR